MPGFLPGFSALLPPRVHLRFTMGRDEGSGAGLQRDTQTGGRRTGPVLCSRDRKRPIIHAPPTISSATAAKNRLITSTSFLLPTEKLRYFAEDGTDFCEPIQALILVSSASRGSGPSASTAS